MSAPNLVPPGTTGGGAPVGGSGTSGTIPKWATSTTLGDSVITQSAGAIATITLTNGGAGYTNGIYSQQALTGGTGTGATADFVVAGGSVTYYTLRAPGVGYVAGDVLSCATIGPGAGLIVTVATVVPAVSTVANVTANRLGAGTTNPRAGLDVALGGAFISGMTEFATPIWAGVTTRLQAHAVIGAADSAANLTGNLGILAGLYYGRGLNANPTGTCRNSGIMSYPRFESSAPGTSQYATALVGFAVRSYAADLATDVSLLGVNAGCFIQTTTGSAATNDATVFAPTIANNMVGHTITTAHIFKSAFTSNAGTITTFSGIRLSPITGAGSIGTFYGLRIEATTTQTITNRWGISQEDTLAKNYFAGNVGIGTTSPASTLDVAGTITCDDAGTGIKLAATPGNADTQTLDCYAEGTWTITDTSGAGLIITPNYPPIVTRCGRLVTFICDITYPATADTSVAQIALPIALITSGYRGHGSAYSSVGPLISLFLNADALFYISAARVTNATLSGARIIFSATYAIT